ncbi:MAG: hypothetical protein RIS67_732, partial [Pseudomonadota bacterium]
MRAIKTSLLILLAATACHASAKPSAEFVPQWAKSAVW